MYKMGLQEVLPEETLVHEYADDIALRRTGREINDHEIAVNKDLEELYERSSELKLELNPGKTKTAFFTTNQHNYKYTPKIDLNGVQLKKESNPVYLGIKLDTELRCRSHIYQTRRRRPEALRSIAGRG